MRVLAPLCGGLSVLATWRLAAFQREGEGAGGVGETDTRDGEGAPASDFLPGTVS